MTSFRPKISPATRAKLTTYVRTQLEQRMKTSFVKGQTSRSNWYAAFERFRQYAGIFVDETYPRTRLANNFYSELKNSESFLKPSDPDQAKAYDALVELAFEAGKNFTGAWNKYADLSAALGTFVEAQRKWEKNDDKRRNDEYEASLTDEDRKRQEEQRRQLHGEDDEKSFTRKSAAAKDHESPIHQQEQEIFRKHPNYLVYNEAASAFNEPRTQITELHNKRLDVLEEQANARNALIRDLEKFYSTLDPQSPESEDLRTRIDALIKEKAGIEKYRETCSDLFYNYIQMREDKV